MQPSIIAMVLAAAVAHAVWNLAAKYKRGDTLLFVCAYTYVSMLLYVPVAIAFVANGEQILNWKLLLGAVVSAVLHTIYSLTLQGGYDRAELGVVYPIARGTGPLLTMFFAIFILGEHLTMIAVFGALLVIAGILVVIGNPFKNANSHPFRGVLWGAATGTTIASYTLWDSYAVTSLHLVPINYYASTLVLQSLILIPGMLRKRHLIQASIRTDIVPIIIVAVFGPLAYILVLTAMQQAPVALVAPLRESSIVIGSLLACRLFHEDHLARRVAGAVIVLGGIIAIGF